MSSIILVFLLLFTIVLEEGATFDDGICWEADGTEGISTFDGQCITPADYDVIFSYENLSSIPVGYQWDGTEYEGMSVAEVYGIELVDDPASDRPIGVGVSADLRTFKERVVGAHAPHMPIAD